MNRPQSLPATVPVQDAPLPETYQHARKALAECHRIDECKDWGDKAQALASYAKQADDDELYKMARRIQGRAVRRCGELLREFQNPTVGLKQNESTVGEGVPPREDTPQSQREAAARAGMSKDQEKTARRVAEVPEGEFEEAVESDDPPSVTALAELGRDSREGFKSATRLLGAVGRFHRYTRDESPGEAADGLMPEEVAPLIQEATDVREWIDRLIERLEAHDGQQV